MKQTKYWWSVFALAVVLLASVAVAQNTPPDVTRHGVKRIPSPANPSSSTLHSPASAEANWGIVFLSEVTLKDSSGNSVSSSEISLCGFEPIEGSRLGNLCIEHDDEQYSLQVDRHVFDRIFCWIENGGTGVYTAPSEPLSADEMKAAGFSRVSPSRTHYVATEFADVPQLVALLRFIDFCPQTNPRYLRAAPDEEKLLRKHNAGIRQGPTWLAWVVSDLDSQFVAILDEGRVIISGVPMVYHRYESEYRIALKEGKPERVFITRIQEFRTVTKNERVDLGMDFARLTALLRTIYNGNRQTWEEFANQHFGKPEVPEDPNEPAVKLDPEKVPVPSP